MTFKTSFYGIPADVRANTVIPLLVGPPGADATVADGSITNAKLANVATATFKGRTTAGTGVPQDLTATQATALLNLADGSLKGLMSAADFTKLAGVASGATANTGTVTTVSVVTANGVSGSVTNAGATPAITLTLGAITPTSVTIGGDAILARDAANTLAQRNSTNAQTFRLYGTFTDASNYERGFMRIVSNVFQIGHEGAGTGTVRTVQIQAGAATYSFLANEVAQWAATAAFEWAGRTRLISPSLGVLALTQNNGTPGDVRLLIGGFTSAFPSLKRSATVLQARLADDSAFAPLQGQLRTDVNATTGLGAGVLAALTNASIVLYDASGQAYRVPCII